MNARQDWLKARQAGIGGSDVSAIMGFNPWKSPLDVYLSKTEPLEEDDQMSEAARWGTILEPVVASEFMAQTGKRVQRITAQLKHPKHPWAMANIDRAIVAEGSRARVADDGGTVLGAEGILEVKTASAYKASDWGRDDDEEAIPLHYQAQGMWYLGVTGLPYCDFAALIGGQKFVVKRIERDDQVIQSMIKRCEAFWFDHVVARKTPDPVNVDDVLKLFPTDNGQACEANEDLLIAYNEAVQLRKAISDAEADLEERIKTLKLAMGPNTALATMGKNLITWKAAKPSTKIDWEAIAKEFAAYVANPEAIIANHTKQVDGSRRFLFAKQ